MALSQAYYDDPMLEEYLGEGGPGAPEAPDPLLAALTDQQFAAVTAPDGPVLVLAGAGTGKTRVLTTRIAYRLRAGDVRPAHVLALTFTNKSGAEMRGRLAGLIGADAMGMDVGTFHAIFAKALRDCDGVAGLGADFTIIDDKDQREILGNALVLVGDEVRERVEKEFKSDVIFDAISRYKMSRLPGQADYVNDLQLNELPEIVRRYDEVKAREKVCDYDDILFQFNDALDHPRLLKMFQTRWRYGLVDEYQDTNAIQLAILKKIFFNMHITCVGDDDQSIYSFRQADVRNILEFDKHWANPTVLRLEENFRSTSRILHHANTLISANTHRHGKTLTATKGDGNPVNVWQHENNYEEADKVVALIRAQIAGGTPRSSIAVIARTSMALQSIERRLIESKIAYTLAAGRKISDRIETKLVAAYVRLGLNPADETAFLYAFEDRPTGIGQVTLSKARSAARQADSTLEDVLTQMAGAPDPKGKYDRLRAFLAGVGTVRNNIGLYLPPAAIVESIIESSGILDRIDADLAKGMKSSKKDEQVKATNLAENRRNNLAEMVAEAGRLEDVSELASNIVLSNERDEAAGDAVWLGTIHAGKGLEFVHVHLPGFEKGIIPSPRVNEDVTSYEYQEERNLAYVALTRAMETLDIHYCMRRNQFGEEKQAGPSVFIQNLPRR